MEDTLASRYLTDQTPASFYFSLLVAISSSPLFTYNRSSRLSVIVFTHL